jgi:hypothetical protein
VEAWCGRRKGGQLLVFGAAEMSEVSVINQAEVEDAGAGQLDLPPGFRFHPTDEEIISHYLAHKALNHRFVSGVIGEVDLNKCEPWDLPG